MTMIPTIICKILMPLEYTVQILFSFRICLIVTTFKKKFVDLDLNKTHITFIKNYWYKSVT